MFSNKRIKPLCNEVTLVLPEGTRLTAIKSFATKFIFVIELEFPKDPAESTAIEIDSPVKTPFFLRLNARVCPAEIVSTLSCNDKCVILPATGILTTISVESLFIDES